MNTTKPPAADRGHDHAEAFCLMQYRDTVTGDVEILWNSRDGVTPFAIQSRAGNEARHVNWDADRYAPDYMPCIGERIFMDRTEEDARRTAEKRVEAYWDDEEHPMKECYVSRKEAVRRLTESQAKKHPETGEVFYGPKTVEVTEGVLKELGLWEKHQAREKEHEKLREDFLASFENMLPGSDEDQADRYEAALRELRDAAQEFITPSGRVLRPPGFSARRLKKAIKKADRALGEDDIRC